MSNLDKAILIATQAHSDQVDKAGQPYILHPLSVMFQFQNEDERIVAVLHDVVEDTHVTLNDLKMQGFSEQITFTVSCLSKTKHENYDAFISRILENDLARRIKIEDIKDNLDITRLTEIRDKDIHRINKYHHALKILING